MRVCRRKEFYPVRSFLTRLLVHASINYLMAPQEESSLGSRSINVTKETCFARKHVDQRICSTCAQKLMSHPETSELGLVEIVM